MTLMNQEMETHSPSPLRLKAAAQPRGLHRRLALERQLAQCA